MENFKTVTRENWRYDTLDTSSDASVLELGGHSNESLGTFVYGYRCRDLVSGADECPRCPIDPETTDSAGVEPR